MAEFKVLETRQDLASKSVVELLEFRLEQARRGEFTGAALAFVRADGGSAQSWTDRSEANGLVGAVTILQHSLIAAVLTDQERSED